MIAIIKIRTSLIVHFLTYNNPFEKIFLEKNFGISYLFKYFFYAIKI